MIVVISWYILKVLIISGILSSYYFLALKDKVFHRWNRFYLLFSVALSLLLPLIKINIIDFFSEQGSVANVIQTFTVQDEIIIQLGRTRSFNYELLMMIGYTLVSLIFIASFIAVLAKIYKIKRHFPHTQIRGINFINTNADGTPFSFFNSIFWNRDIDLSSVSGQQIFNHEIAHITEKHTYDKIFMNVILWFFWINPFFWLIRKELNMIHEFIADKIAIEDADVNAFAEMILNSVYPKKQFLITNNFFYSPIKRRLLMLTKNKNTKANYVSRLLALPLAVVIFVAISCKAKTNADNENATDSSVKTSAQTDTNAGIDTLANNKTVTGMLVRENGDSVRLTFNDGTQEYLTIAEAEKRGYRMPPPPPPPPAPLPPPPPPPPPTRTYNGKAIKVLDRLFPDGSASIIYEDGTKETISAKEAKKLGFVRFTPPKVVKDNNGKTLPPPEVKIQFTPPKVVKDNSTEPLPPQLKEGKQDPGLVFTKVEQPAQFPGGSAAWSKYITRAIDKNIDAISADKGNSFGTCVVRFIVDKNGTVSNVQATTMKNTELAKVAVDAIRKGPKWTPAMQNGKNVNAYRLQPVTLKNPD